MIQVIFPVLLLALLADVRGCVCDPVKPETMDARACSLTHVAVDQTGTAAVIFQKDSSPTKPNRWLAIPHALHHTLNEMSPEERNVYWTAAIAKAHELWGEDWAIAINSLERRSQCQLHAHIGKLLAEADKSGGILVDGPEAIPVPPDGGSIWIRPDQGKLRVYSDNPAPETNIMR
jgi:hypothetical protein